ncbi:hypothetical protein ES705_10551 [subsurface metagenome]
MDLAYIKILLQAMGITNLAMRFDDPNRQIVATFRRAGQTQTKRIDFVALEELFTQGPTEATAGPSAKKLLPTGTE